MFILEEEIAWTIVNTIIRRLLVLQRNSSSEIMQYFDTFHPHSQ